MILWINGAFGAGKTQTAYELHRRLPRSCVYDPENVGFFLRKMLPAELRKDDFQDEPLWRRFNAELLASRLESRRSWAAQQIERCIRAFDGEIAGEKIQTDHLRISQTAEEIAARAGLPLAEDTRSAPRRAWDRLVMQCRHIR